MGQSVFRAGTVIDGDFKGKGVYNGDYVLKGGSGGSYVIVSNDENGKIIVKSLFPTHFTTLKEISKNTVDHYVEVSNNKTKSYDIALYFKDGQKSLIRIDSRAYQNIKSMLFVL